MVHADEWRGYLPLESRGVVHQITYLKGKKEAASELLPRVHLVISLLKRWLMGIHRAQSAISIWATTWTSSPFASTVVNHAAGASCSIAWRGVLASISTNLVVNAASNSACFKLLDTAFQCGSRECLRPARANVIKLHILPRLNSEPHLGHELRQPLGGSRHNSAANVVHCTFKRERTRYQVFRAVTGTNAFS